jgi:hypothetical protein
MAASFKWKILALLIGVHLAAATAVAHNATEAALIGSLSLEEVDEQLQVGWPPA